MTGCDTTMKKYKLNYRFHNPNLAETTADFLLRIMLEVNADKVETAIKNAANHTENIQTNLNEKCSA